MKTRSEKAAGGPLPEKHLRDYWRVIWNGRWTVLAILAVVTVLGTVGTLLQKPVYEAAVTLEINARPRGVVPGGEVAQLGATEYGYLAEVRYFNTQFQIIQSRSVAGRVMDDLGLRQHPTFVASEDPVLEFSNRILVDPVEETGVVRIRVRAGDPNEAALWANKVAETYVERNLEEAVRTTEETVQRLVQRLQPLRDELRASEEERFQYAGEQSLYVPEDSARSLRERLTLLEKDQTEAQMKRLELQGVYDKVQEIDRAGGDFLVIPQVAEDEIVRGLLEQRNRAETELRKLQVTYKQGHFKVQEKESELEKVQQKMDSEIQRIVASINTEYSLLTARENQLTQRIRDIREESLSQSQKASEYEVMKAESGDTKKIYDLISTKIKEVELNTKLLRNNVSIVDAAIVPSGPVSPKRRLNVAISFALGLFIGLGTVFFLDYLDNTVKTSEDVEQYLGMSILAVIPRQGAASEAIARESFQSLRTNLNFSSLNRSRKVILVTSAGPQEGKTSTIVTLAKVQATAGERVVLLDCDLRRPNVHNHLQMKRNFGLTNYLADGTADNSWQKYLKSAPDVPNLHIMTCGPIPPNPPELFGTDRFKTLLQELKEHYHWVLIDAPPVASLTDAVILSSLADMVAIVIRHRENDKELVRRSVESLRAVNPHVVGAILNDVDLDRSHYRDYYYAGYYYYGSGESEEGKEPRKRFLKKRKVG